MRRSVCLAILCPLIATCDTLTFDLDGIRALELDPGPFEVEVGDSLRLDARVVNGSGETVTNAIVTWQALDIDSGQVGFQVDSSGLIQGIHQGAGRVQAQTLDIRSDPIVVAVTPLPDSIAVDQLRTTVAPSDTASAPFTFTVFATDTSGVRFAIANKRLALTLSDIGAGDGQGSIFIQALGDSISPGTSVITHTASNGQAMVQLNTLAGASRPDSIQLTASPQTARGGTIVGVTISVIVVFTQAP